MDRLEGVWVEQRLEKRWGVVLHYRPLLPKHRQAKILHVDGAHVPPDDGMRAIHGLDPETGFEGLAILVFSYENFPEFSLAVEIELVVGRPRVGVPEIDHGRVRVTRILGCAQRYASLFH